MHLFALYLRAPTNPTIPIAILKNAVKKYQKAKAVITPATSLPVITYGIT